MPRDGARTLDRVPKVRAARALLGAPTCHGAGAFKVPDWIALMTRDCRRKQSPGLADACAAQCPHLLKLAIEDASQDGLRSGSRRGPVQD